jgi:uncharacterized protein
VNSGDDFACAVGHTARMPAGTSTPRVPLRLDERAWTVITAVGALSWALLVALAPPGFFAWATAFGLLWLVLSVLAAPAGLSSRLRPTAADVALGAASGLALYALSRGFMWATCGGLTEGLRAPVAALLARFETRAVLPAFSLFFVLAPAEELFWRGVVQARLAPRLGSVRAIAVATGLAALLALATGEPLLAAAIVPTYGVWGALAAWRDSLVPAVVSHALWSTLIALWT